MNEITADNLLPAEPGTSSHHGPSEALPKLMLGAVGVVYGDIGTSPLYTMKESFLGPIRSRSTRFTFSESSVSSSGL